MKLRIRQLCFARPAGADYFDPQRDVDGHSDFDFLPGIGLRSQAIANDLLEPPNRPFDPRAFVVTRSVSATDPTAFGDIPQRPSEWRCVGLVSAVALSTALSR